MSLIERTFISSINKICFLAPGERTIPPQGWGALETVVWNQYSELQKLGLDVHILNEKDPSKVISAVRELNPTIIHLHYGSHYDLMPQFNCRKIVTNHDGSFKFSGKFHDTVVRRFLYDCEFFCLSEYERRFFTRIGISQNKVKILPNGVTTKNFRTTLTPEKEIKSICVGRIDERKRQHLLQQRLLNIDFVGEVATDKFDATDRNYLGSWTREQIYHNMTDYANLVLLSSSENCAPLVCLEALSAGLGLVISEACIESLDLSKPFIKVIPEDKLTDVDYIEEALKINRMVSVARREEIIEYAKSRDCSEMAKIYRSYL